MEKSTEPSWNLESEFSGFSSEKFQQDLQFVKSSIVKIQQISKSTSSSSIKEFLLSVEPAEEVLHDMTTYVMCRQSVDMLDAEANAFENQLFQLRAQLSSASTLLHNYIIRCSDEEFNSVLSSTEMQKFIFKYQLLRKEKDFLLSDTEEQLIAELKNNGYMSWGSLYDEVSGEIKVTIDVSGKPQTMGLAQALGYSRGSDPVLRESAWRAVQQAWKVHQTTAAKILNSIFGWRQDLLKKRSYKKPFHYLDEALFYENLKKSTLDAMFAALEKHHDAILEIPKTLATILQTSEPNRRTKNQLHPWDLDSPCPIASTGENIPYEKAIAMIQQAYGQIHPEFGDFVKFMNDSNFIEGRTLPNKSPGGYCTDFCRSGTTRIFLTYTGSVSDILTVAHEIGHAFHSWLVRDLSFVQKNYTHSLAETASVFGETVFTDFLLQQATRKEEKISMLWNELMRGYAFMINIPARYELETQLNEERMKGPLTAEKVTALNKAAWEKWYKDSLTEMDEMFWAWKGHFYSTYSTFYNFPYTFGYLFSLSIYATQKTSGPDFFNNFKNILRDTTCLSAEEIIQKHLGKDISKIDFWEKPILSILEKQKELKSLLQN